MITISLSITHPKKSDKYKNKMCEINIFNVIIICSTAIFGKEKIQWIYSTLTADTLVERKQQHCERQIPRG